jgi:predicted nucleic acid-binding protein
MAARLREPPRVFVDSGAWIALAADADPHHERAVEAWEALERVGTRLVTSLPVVMETFTFLDRYVARDVAQAWRRSLDDIAFLKLVECRTRDLAEAWRHFDRADLHKLSAVDATSFVIMEREELRRAFTFDHHFAAVGFQIVG